MHHELPGVGVADHVRGMRELAPPQRLEAPVEAKRRKHAVARVVPDRDPALGVVQRRVGDGAARRAADLDQLSVGGILERDPDQVDWSRRDTRAQHRRRVLVPAVVEQPQMPALDHGIPPVRLAISS